MPNFFERLFGRNNRRSTPATPAAPGTTTGPSSPTTAPGGGDLRTLNYEEGRNAVRPPAADATSGPAATPAAPAAAPAEETTSAPTIDMPRGEDYTVTAEDVGYNRSATLGNIAEQHGTIAWRLEQANEELTDIAAGTTIYIPSPAEQLYADCVKQAGDDVKGAALFAEVSAAGGLELMTGAREAASGKSGESYGTSGVDGAFFATNPELAGASKRRMTDAGGTQVYKVIWASNFWKCNLFANETVYRGGYETSMRPNDHYTTAGAMHLDRDTFSELSPEAAFAGCVTTLTSGTGGNESHSGVLGSMPIVSKDEDGNTVVEFTFIGASTDRAKEQDKRIVLSAGTNKILSGDSHKELHFLKPNKKRDDA